MVKVVIKKGGKREEFNLEKIKNSLLNVFKEMGLKESEKEKITEKIISKILEFLREKKEVFTSEIEAEIVLQLEKEIPEAVEVWRKGRIEKKEKVK